MGEHRATLAARRARRWTPDPQSVRNEASMTKIPYASVIVPVKNGGAVLRRALAAICASDLPREAWELIVVDDGSSDQSAIVAGEYADLVIRLGRRSHGPAYARNRGVDRARGQVVAFFDADVLVQPDTLPRMLRVLATNPDVAALFGAYDDSPGAPGLVSQYRNLLHHYTHTQNPGDAHTFWGACGAVRRDVFLAAGAFDEWRYSRPQIEDIDLGLRIRAGGHRIVLRPEIQVKHLKVWTLRNMMRTDFTDRGVPWTRLLVEQGELVSVKEERARVLNLSVRERANTIIMWTALAAFAAMAVWRRPVFLVAALVALAWVLVDNRALYAWFWKSRGVLFSIAILPLHLAYYVIAGVSVLWGWTVNHVVGEPRPDPSIEAFSELGVETWPPVPVNRNRTPLSVSIPPE
jgi:glycosyltransferase involved in cell wall biosynthesis